MEHLRPLETNKVLPNFFSVCRLTCNQTVMSGLLALENSDKSAVFRHVRRRLFASVHGVSVVNLWSVHDRYARGQNYFAQS
jgi:hypothetical protein